MPSPREIALKTNRPENFDEAVDAAYDAEAGIPAGVMPARRTEDYAAGLKSLPLDADPLPAVALKR
jgi:hypothetical protein